LQEIALASPFLVSGTSRNCSNRNALAIQEFVLLLPLKICAFSPLFKKIVLEKNVLVLQKYVLFAVAAFETFGVLGVAYVLSVTVTAACALSSVQRPHSCNDCSHQNQQSADRHQNHHGVIEET
jgi:hypothetical protein